MGKWITGVLKTEIHFNDVYVEDDQDVLDVLFPEGYEGEMWASDLKITSEQLEDDEIEEG